MNASFRVSDRRRVTPSGSVRPTPPASRPAVPHRPIRDKVNATWRHVSTHLERGLSGDLQPAQLWTHLWGLALSAKQTHDAIVSLVAERMRPRTLPLQSAILVRSSLEALGNIMALTANPSSIRWFIADGYRRQWEQLRVQRRIFGNRPDWVPWFGAMDAMLDMDAADIGLGRRRRRDPTRTIPDWPTPHWLTRPRRLKSRKRPLRVLLKGNRAKLFDEAHRFWYSQLSSYTHQRCAAARMAVFANAPDVHSEPGLLESNVVVEGLTFFAAAMSELEVAAAMPPSIDLRALWAILWDLDEEVRRLISIRYRRLLRMSSLDAGRRPA